MTSDKHAEALPGASLPNKPGSDDLVSRPVSRCPHCSGIYRDPQKPGAHSCYESVVAERDRLRIENGTLRAALEFIGKAFELQDDQTDSGFTYREALTGTAEKP